jgi:hypothetical protein
MHFKIINLNEKNLSTGECIYSQNDYYLEYIEIQHCNKTENKKSLANQINERMMIDSKSDNFLVIVDTLTLVFDKKKGDLKTLDAFTNKNRWIKNLAKKIPQTIDNGILTLCNFANNDDRDSINIFPKYEYPGTDDWVRIVFFEDKNIQYYKVSSNLIVGLTNGKLSEIFLLNLKTI